MRTGLLSQISTLKIIGIKGRSEKFKNPPVAALSYGIGYRPGLWILDDSIRIRIRIQKVIESGSNPHPDTDPDPPQYFRRQMFQRFKNEP
jgi:hypothetical protein